MRKPFRSMLTGLMAVGALSLAQGAMAHDRGPWRGPPGPHWSHTQSHWHPHHDRRAWPERHVVRERVYVHGAPLYYDSRVYYGPVRYASPVVPRDASVVIHLPPIVIR